ncbi:inorganic phosphate transporter [Streptacidiphilus jiangxiensis]|uniref:Phosphate transporter n=1 Tax=Streptacidiphilus jiangxiensis TaxID=235985 RepID=A0A1H7G4G4_STRJI|nr:inorganic phosphate transporter [Streptacidiphilus jiangxiensis]SEK33008.1 inorganic phosphate transporter, PiT family [Streptacidiphilus jiangxiensis]
MEHVSFLVTAVVITALAFDFTNGFHDTANSMATSIATGALRPKIAVAISAVLNLAGAFLSVAVAKTISGGILDEKAGLKPQIVFAALIGAIVWNLVTWLRGIPSSSSHALYGGLIGATLFAVGSKGVHLDVVLTKIIIPAVASPIVAGIAAWAATRLAYRMTRNGDEQVNRKGFKYGQVASSMLVSVAHGTSDGQKTMGVITLTLITAGTLAPGSNPPLWVILAAGVTMALGTYIGGWRIIRTMGKGISDIEPAQGFTAQSAAATVILTSSHMGFGLSTTHVCSGGIMGAGKGRADGVVHWSTARRMAYAWLLTLPAAGLVGGLGVLLADQGAWGEISLGAIGVGVAAWIYVLSRRQKVDAANVVDATPNLAESAPTVAAPNAPVAA